MCPVENTYLLLKRDHGDKFIFYKLKRTLHIIQSYLLISRRNGKICTQNGTQAALNRFISKYPQYSFLHISIKNWKCKFSNQKKYFLSLIFNKRRRPNLVRDDFLQKIREVVMGVRLSGAVISRGRCLFPLAIQ